MVVPLPELEETPEDAEMPEDDEPDEDLPVEDEPVDDVPEDEDLLEDEAAALPEDDPEVAFFAVEELVPVPLCVDVAAEAWVVCAPTTAAVAVAAVAARAVVQVIFLTRRRPAVLAWTACRKWELVMPTGKPARF